ncbi:hypothetical protein HSBAA_28600 [Vreelandella sulfidaeris]|uniref:Uncharacterized protein n=1 Tax=Vreelandella sulfidaeris TaxID=115553 RepID=A0A455UEJ3_9GAMM|nr:hypothetical protein HSBAA_28600 [Halomonas sulfidaeris]
MAEDAREFLNIESLDWHTRQSVLTDHSINKFKPLMTRVERDKIDAMIEASKEDLVEEQKLKEAPKARWQMNPSPLKSILQRLRRSTSGLHASLRPST